METPCYSLPRLRIKKFKNQPAWGQPSATPAQSQAPTGQGASVMPPSQAASFITRITHSCFTSQACTSASPSPRTSTPQVGIITLVGSCKKPPQLLLRGDDATNQQQSLLRPREEPRKKTPCHPQANVVFHVLRLHSWELHKPCRYGGGPCSTSRSHATSWTRGAPHLREVPHLYPQSHTAGRTNSTASCAPASLVPHYCGVSASCCLPSHHLPARRAAPRPGHTAGSACRGHSTLVLNPQGHPSSHQPQATPGTQKLVLHAPQGPAKRKPCSNGRQSLMMGTAPQVHRYSKEWARTMAHPRHEAGDHHSRAQERANSPRAELKGCRGHGCGKAPDGAN